MYIWVVDRRTADDILPSSLLSDNKTALANAKSLSYIVCTSNFVNISSNKNSNESSYTLTLKGNNDQIFIEIARDGQLAHGMISCVYGVCSRDQPIQ